MPGTPFPELPAGERPYWDEEDQPGPPAEDSPAAAAVRAQIEALRAEMGDPRPDDAVLNAAEQAEQAGDPAAAIATLEETILRLRSDLEDSQRSVRNAIAAHGRDAAELAKLRDRLSYTADNNRDDAEAYRYLRDEIINLLNPRDDDASEESIMVDAVRLAAEFIEAQPCACGPDVQEPEWETPCPRCQALGRRADKREER